MRHKYKVGDNVIYRKTLHRERPSDRACSVRPSKHGDDYSYVIDKYRKVKSVTPEGELILVTPKGHTESVKETSPCLKKAGWFQSLLHYRDFARIA